MRARVAWFALLLFLASQAFVFLPPHVRPGWIRAPGRGPSPEPPALTLFSADYHIAPLMDITSFFEVLRSSRLLNGTIINRSLSGHCHLPKTCDTTNLGSVLGIYQCTSADLQRARQFVSAEWAKLEGGIDVVLCSYPLAMCEVFAPLGTPMFLHVVVNMELGRETLPAWHRWVRSLRAIAADPRNVITANNLYDLEYTYYFTGVLPEYMPTYAYYAIAEKAVEVEQTSQILLAKTRYVPDSIISRLTQNPQLVPIAQAFPGGFGPYSSLRAFQAVVIMPYTKSIMSFFEYYGLNMPIIVPSAAFLVKLVAEHGLMKERIYWQGPDRDMAKSATPAVAAPSGFRLPPPLDDVPSPNSLDVGALEYWIPRSDFYTYPHIIYFDSFEELDSIYTQTDFAAVSEKMREYNEQVKQFLLHKWQGWISRIKAPPAAVAAWDDGEELTDCSPAHKFFQG